MSDPTAEPDAELRHWLTINVPRDVDYARRILECLEMGLAADAPDDVLEQRRKEWVGIKARRELGLSDDASTELLRQRAEERHHMLRRSTMDM